MNIQFPIRKADGTQYTNADELLNALVAEKDGHYLLGAHGCWHGGIHISDTSAPQCVQQEPVRCIADGEVVAYRLNRDYLTSTFAGTAETNTLQYSSSFCLVRHHYQSPANASESPDQGQTNQLTFYSLYMHLAPYTAYLDDYPPSNESGVQQNIIPSPRKQPPYWQGYVEATARHHNYARKRPLGDPAYRIGRLAVTSTMGYHTSTVQTVMVDGKSQLMAECILLTGGLSDSLLRLDGPFWTDIDDKTVTRKPVMPTEFDRVVACQVPIKAGDPIGYLGLYESPASHAGDKDSQYQVHIEVFSCDADLDGYLKNPAGLTDGKQYLQIASGQQLSSKGGTDAAPSFHPQGRPTTQEFIVDYSEASQHQEANGKEWFGVTLPQGAASLTGFVPKDDVHLITAHDREKLGFKIVREENENADGLIDVEQMPGFFRQLHREIDAKGRADGKVSLTEMQAAQRDPILRQRWGKLIAYHPTEWQAKSDAPKWQSLKELLKDSPELLRHESERIDNLVFWDELSGATQVVLPKQVYHFHPIDLVESFVHKNCACNRNITKDELKLISPRSSDNSIDAHLESINNGFSRFGITKCREKSHFLAQALHESGGLKFTSEINGASAPYAPWYGRGLIQLTLQANYLAYENYIGEDVTSSAECMKKLTLPPHCALSAFWFYKIHKNLDKIAEQDDFIKLTAKINGGFNGYNDRVSYFSRAAEVLRGEHLSIIEKAGKYLFEDSAIYGERIYSFGWGLWHDPESTRHGVTKSRAEALQGYKRARDLIVQTPFPASQNNNKIYGVRYENLLAFINTRIQVLGGS